MTLCDITDLLAAKRGVDARSVRIRVLPIANELLQIGVVGAGDFAERAINTPIVSAQTRIHEGCLNMIAPVVEELYQLVPESFSTMAVQPDSVTCVSQHHGAATAGEVDSGAI